MRRRTALTVLVAAGVVILLGAYIVYTRWIANELRTEARQSSRILARVLAGQADPNESGALLALGDLTVIIRDAGVPLVVTDGGGAWTATANLPTGIVSDTTKMRQYLAALDAENAPVVDATTGIAVHFGSTASARSLRIVPVILVSSLALLLLAAMVLVLTHGRAEREHVWAGMARESAHQIGTPLSSLHGWMTVLRERAGDPSIDQVIDHMTADVERLERVAHRFERIGRPPKRESVDVSALVNRVVTYFEARVPRLATPVHFRLDVPNDGLSISGDRVLLEWVLESLIKNAVDALSGVGGTITVRGETLAGGRVRIRVTDDGPGVPPALRRRIFDAGFSTKERGWGIGLALARRIVEENHGGTLALAPTDKGAAFDIILPS